MDEVIYLVHNVWWLMFVEEYGYEVYKNAWHRK